MSFSVTPSVLQASANRIDDSGVNIGQETVTATQPSVTAMNANVDWQAGQGLSDCVTAWSDRLGELAAALQQTATNLADNANGYQSVDNSIADELHQIASGLGGA
jgi:uncharacterized protein YukE